MLKAIFLILFSITPLLSFASTLSCGGAFVTVSDAPSADEPFFSVAIEGGPVHSNHQFEIQKDYLYLRCEVTSMGKHVVLINHFCGGSGCVGFGNFGIVEVSSGKVLLEPDQPYKGNLEQAKDIMGVDIKPFLCELTTIEICFHSKIELG